MAHPTLRRALVGASTLLCTSALVVLPALGASAIDYDVDDSGGATYSDIQSAVNAATVAGVTAGVDKVVVAPGTYVAFTVNVDGLTIVGAGAATTTVTGTTVLNGTTDLSGFTLQSQTTASPPPGPYGTTVINLGSGAEGSDIHDNVIRNGYQGIYAENVDATSADPTTITDNVFTDIHASQGSGVWLSNSENVVVTGNQFENAVADENAVGVNLQCSGRFITIDDNEFTNLGNAVAVISAGAGCPAGFSDIVIENNDVNGFSGSGAFYFGGNNIIDSTVRNNTAKNALSPAGALVKFGDYFTANPGGGIQGFSILGNTFTDADYGVLIQAGVDVASPISIVNNTFCRIAIENVENATGNAGNVLESGTITNCNLTTLPGGTGGTGGGAASGQLETLADSGSEGAPLGAVVAALIAAVGVALVVRARRAAATSGHVTAE